VLDSLSGCPARSSLGVGRFFRARELRVCPGCLAVAPPLPKQGGTARAPGSASPGVLSPCERHYVGCPVSPARLSPRGRTRVARPSPVPSSGFLPLSTVQAALAVRVGPLRGPALSVAPRRFAALFHAARVLGSRPAELSLPGEPYPLSRASVLPCGFVVDCRRRDVLGVSRPLSPPRRSRCRTSGWAWRRLRSRDCGSLRSLRSHQRRAQGTPPV